MSSTEYSGGREQSTIDGLVQACAADERFVAAFMGGSRARGEADEHSDLDISVIVADDAYDALIAEKDRFVRKIGEPLFLEDFGHTDMALVVFADGVELDLFYFQASDLASIRSGPFLTLFDRHGILTGMEFPPAELDREAQRRELRRILAWFWHDVGHLATAIGRGQLWWAAGQLEQLRHYCVKLVRLEQHVVVEDEPYWKLDAEISTDALEELRSTFVPVERDAMLGAAREVVAYFRRRAPIVAGENGLTYPSELDAVVGGRLDYLNTG